jgi:hypothetical protein
MSKRACIKVLFNAYNGVKGKQEEGTMREAPHLPQDRSQLMKIRVFILQRAIVLQREKLSYGHYFGNNARTEEGTFGHNFITGF